MVRPRYDYEDLTDPLSFWNGLPAEELEPSFTAGMDSEQFLASLTPTHELAIRFSDIEEQYGINAIQYEPYLVVPPGIVRVFVVEVDEGDTDEDGYPMCKSLGEVVIPSSDQYTVIEPFDLDDDTIEHALTDGQRSWVVMSWSQFNRSDAHRLEFFRTVTGDIYFADLIKLLQQYVEDPSFNLYVAVLDPAESHQIHDAFYGR